MRYLKLHRIPHNSALREVYKYGVFSGPCFPVFGLNTGKYGPEKTPYLDIFRAVSVTRKLVLHCTDAFCNRCRIL